MIGLPGSELPFHQHQSLSLPGLGEGTQLLTCDLQEAGQAHPTEA